MKITNFQLALLSVFVVFIVFGVLIFSGAIKIGEKKTSDLYQGKVVVWGTLPQDSVSDIFDSLEVKYDKLSIAYVKKNADTINSELAEAIASGSGPDAFFVSNETLIPTSNKSYVVPFASFPIATYRSTFVEGAEIFLNSQGVMAYPFTIDPLVLYWNRDLFNKEGLVAPPKTWEEMYSYSEKLSKRTQTGVITQSAIALGGYSNIKNAKDIISMLFLQSGTSIVATGSDGSYVSTLNSYLPGTKIKPAESALRFYTEFANPTSKYYSWSASLTNSYDSFVSGKLAMYIGYSSEIYGIRDRNPNLNFDITNVPQLEGATKPVTFGKIYGVSVSKSSKNLNSALLVAQTLSSKESVAFISAKSLTLPVRRELLVSVPDDPYKNYFYQSALLAKSWLDPAPFQTNTIFASMISDATSGFLSLSETISKASDSLSKLLK